MSWLVIDIVLCLIVYSVLLSIFIFKSQKRRRDFGEDDDGDGGIPVSFPPDFDLPPGICLPDDPKLKKKEPEEIFA